MHILFQVIVCGPHECGRNSVQDGMKLETLSSRDQVRHEILCMHHAAVVGPNWSQLEGFGDRSSRALILSTIRSVAGKAIHPFSSTL